MYLRSPKAQRFLQPGWLWAFFCPLLSLALIACVDADPGNSPLLRIGAAAPDFSLNDSTGKPVRLSDFKGQPILINFWATWCAACKIEMPEIASALQQHGAQGLAVLGIDPGEEVGLVQKYLGDGNYTWPTLFDPAQSVKNSYRIVGYPTSFFVDRRGIIRATQVGGMDATSLAENLAKILP